MKFAALIITALAGMFPTTTAQCGPVGSFSIAGSSTVLPIAEAWATAYSASCPGVSISVEGGGSSAGAGRVCANEEKGTPVEIGDMSREWKDTEAIPDDQTPYIYNCVAGDTSRSVSTEEDGKSRHLLGARIIRCVRFILPTFLFDLPGHPN